MITFHWKQPKEANGVINNYEILCYDKQFRLHSVNNSQTTATLSGLQPYTNYFCSITAYTSVGGGPAAATNVTTEQDSEFYFIDKKLKF